MVRVLLSCLLRASSRAPVVALVVALTCAPTLAQNAAAPLPELAEFAQLPAVTGSEAWLLRSVTALLPPGFAWEEDAFGSVIVRGRGAQPGAAGAVGPAATASEPAVTRLIAVGVDEPGYVVSQIRDDGYLRLRFLGRAATPAFHLAHEGQPARVLARDGLPEVLRERPGVLLVNSIHLKNPRPTELDESALFLDVGADSPADVTALGIALLDPVAVREVTAFGGGRVAAPDLGQRAAALALLTVLRDMPHAELATALHDGLAFAFVAQSQPGNGPLGRGGEGVLRRLSPEHVLLLRGRDAAGSATSGPAPLTASGATWSALELRTAHAGTPVETVTLEDLAAFTDALRTEVNR